MLSVFSEPEIEEARTNGWTSTHKRAVRNLLSLWPLPMFAQAILVPQKSTMQTIKIKINFLLIYRKGYTTDKIFVWYCSFIFF